MKMAKKIFNRDYQYEIRIGGIKLVTGDASSIGVIFGNLDGRNFDRKGFKHQTHGEWLSNMRAEFGTPLELGARIKMLSPEGVILEESTIGRSLSVETSS